MGKEVKKVEFKDFLDTKGLSEDESKVFEVFSKGLDGYMEALFAQFIKDEIDSKSMKESIDNATKSIEDLKKEVNGFADSESINERLKSFEETIVRIKAATEKTNGGTYKLKSIEDQLREQLKAYITENNNGCSTVDLKSACKASPGNKLELNLVVNTKDAAVISSGSLAPHYGVEIDPNLSVNPRSQTVIRNYASVSGTNSRSLIYAEYVSKDGDAAWVPEGGLKPLMDATLAEKTVTAAKVAIAAKFTEETLSDFPSFVNEVQTEMVNKLGIKEEQGILSGAGTSGEIKGVAADMPAFSLTNFYIDRANMFDALVAAYSQIVSTSEMAYRPNLVLMNPLDYASMQLTKDANGQYLRPFRYNDELIQGLRVETTTAVAQGDFIMGDFSYLNIRDLWALSISIGWENDDFRKNIVTVIAEKRLMCYIKSQYKTAFVKDKFNTVIEGITKSID